MDNDLIEHPFETWGLMRLQDNCNVFDACVRQVASDVIGQGYELLSKKQTDQNENGKKVLTGFLERVNDDNEGINDILEKAIIDLMTVGWYGIEVSRDNKMIDGLWHIPAHTIFANRDGQRYCQVRDDVKTWFVKFNSDLKINKDTGKKSGKGDANEIIFGGRYYAQSSSYGAPPILPAVGEVKSLIGIRDYNLSFFENYGIPAALVTLEGEWDEDACKQLSDFINAEIKGTENAHKTAVIETPEGGKLTWNPLVIEKKEGSFHIYYKSQRDAVLTSYRMPPYRVGIAEQGSLGGSTAKESTRIYNDSVVKPLELKFSKIMSEVIKGRGVEDLVLKFNPLDTRDMAELVDRWKILFGMGAINVNYIREQMGLDKAPHGDDYYILKSYIPVGEETMKQREETFDITMDEIHGKLDRILREKQIKLDDLQNLKEEISE